MTPPSTALGSHQQWAGGEQEPQVVMAQLEQQQQDAPPTPTVLLCTPEKAKGMQEQQYRYLCAGDCGDDEDSNCGDTSSLAVDSSSNAERDRESASKTASAFVYMSPPPEGAPLRPPSHLSSSYPSSSFPPPLLPCPSPSSLSLQKKLLSADRDRDRQLHCMQALCEADLRAVISGHEDLAERQQTLLEGVHARLLEASQAADFHKKATAKVTCE